MKILGNSTRDLNPYQKYLLHRCCTMPITLYGFQLWYYNKAPLLYPMKIMNKIQRRVALWIVGSFKTAPLMDIEAIASLTSINLHLQKIKDRLQLRAYSLSSSHILCSLMSSCNKSSLHQHPLLLNSLTKRQHSLIKGYLVDINNYFNEVFPSFDPINPELFPGHRIINTFSNCFLFQPFNKQVNCNVTSWVQKLDRIAIESLESSSTALVILDASVKNNITTSIAHIHIRDRPITKTLYHTLNVISTKAKLVAIRCSIN